MSTIFAGGKNGPSGVFRFRRNNGNLPYMFAKKNEVIIGSFGNNGHNDDGNFNLRVVMDGDKLAFNGGKGEFAKWEVEPENGKARIQSKKNGKYLRIKQDGSIDVAGAGGKWTLFKVEQLGVDGKAMRARLQSVETGKYLHVGKKEFTQHYMFAKKNTVILKHVGGQNVRVDPKNDKMPHHEGGLGGFALWTAEPENNGKECRFMSQKTGKYLRIFGQDNTLDVAGGTGPWTLFTVHKEGDGKVKLQAKKNGKYIAFKDGAIRTGGGGKFCVLEIFRKN